MAAIILKYHTTPADIPILDGETGVPASVSFSLPIRISFQKRAYTIRPVVNDTSPIDIL